MYLSGLIPIGTVGVRVQSCLPPAFLPGFPGRLTSPFQGLLSWGYSLGNHTEWSPTGTASRFQGKEFHSSHLGIIIVSSLIIWLIILWFFFCLLDSPGLLQFEVCPLSESRFNVSFQHPVNDSLVCGELYGWLPPLMAAIWSLSLSEKSEAESILNTSCIFCLSVVMDVQDSTHVSCKLYKGLSDALICTDDFIAKVVQR